ncbi:MAG: DUF934 domain-containing protein [Piscirickettsiaceae bacterium]|nr:DUF934 domain-containing protein [Piscirickettsiaceae bacterium]
MKNVISLNNQHEATIIADDKWLLLEEGDNAVDLCLLSNSGRPLGNLIIPFEPYLTTVDSVKFPQINAVSLSNDKDVDLLTPWLDTLSLIVLDFPKFTDGRAYSQAVELRRHLNWQGEIRAKGDVLQDQLSHMHRCGFTSFAIRQDKDPQQALKGLAGISVLYASSVIEPEPLFKRRLI